MENNTGEIQFVKPCTSSFQHPTGCVCVCVCVCVCEWGARPRLSFSWLCFRDECWMQIHWGSGFQWLRGLLFIGEMCIWQSQLWTTGWKLIHISGLAVWILSEILASTTEMLSSAANLGHLQCHFLLLLCGNPVLPWSFQTSCPVSKGPTLPSFYCI